MKNLFFGILIAAYIVTGVVQWFAIVDGFAVYFGWHSGIATWIIAGFLTYIPFVGTISGIYGAHHAWAWDWGPSIALFGWSYAVGLLYIVGSAIVERR